MSYLIDWSQTSADGTTAVTDGSGRSIDVTVSTPANGKGKEFYVSNPSGWGDHALRADAVSDPIKATMTFSEPVKNVTFELFDVDAGDCFDDKVTIIALDAAGNPVDVVFSNTSSTHQVSGNTVSGSGNHGDGIAGSGAPDSLTVTVMGEIVSLQIIQDNGDEASRSGTIGVSDISFDAADSALDGIVEGTENDDLIDVAYTGDPEGDRIDNNDAVLGDAGSNDDIVEAGAGNDTVRAGEGNDTIYGGAGDDDLAGENGNDVIYGDTGGRSGGTVRESFEWDLAPDSDGSSIDNGDPITGFTQDTGNVQVTFSVVSTTGNSTSTFQNSPQQIAGIDGGDETVDNASSLSLTNNGTNDSGTYALDFSTGVENVQFRVNDIDNSGVIRVMAYDPAGNPIEVTLTGADGVTLSDEDGVAGADTARSNGGNEPDASERFSVLVEIPGPVGRIEIVHEQDGPNNSGTNVTDVYFDAPSGAGVAGNDFISGGAGDDMLYGEDGDDTISGGPGNDYIEGGAGNDSIHGGGGDDTLIGGAGNDTLEGSAGNDSIDGGTGGDRLFGGGGRDTIDGGDGDDTIGGGSDDDTIMGGSGNDAILGGNGDDVIDGGAGNDTIEAGGGNDTVTGSEGDDSIIGGAGEDLINGGAGNDTLAGGDDADTFTGLNPGDVVFGGAGFTPGVSTDFDTLDLTGSVTPGGSYKLENVRTDSDGNGIDGTVVYSDADGKETGRLTFENIEKIIPCFTPGTLIATPRGERLVEELREGDRIITRDNGIQEIRWIGEKRLSFADLTRQPHLQPVLIRKGALGHNLPERDMLVSPNHRMLVANDKTSLYFEEREVLVAAKHLVNDRGIQSVEALGVSYIHFMFDQHEVVLSDGSWTESFQPGDYTLNGIDKAQRQEILSLFPELENHAGIEGYQSARRTLKRHEAMLLAE